MTLASETSVLRTGESSLCFEKEKPSAVWSVLVLAVAFRASDPGASVEKTRCVVLVPQLAAIRFQLQVSSCVSEHVCFGLPSMVQSLCCELFVRLHVVPIHTQPCCRLFVHQKPSLISLRSCQFANAV